MRSDRSVRRKQVSGRKTPGGASRRRLRGLHHPPPLVYGRNCPGNMARLVRLVRISPLLPSSIRTTDEAWCSSTIFCTSPTWSLRRGPVAFPFHRTTRLFPYGKSWKRWQEETTGGSFFFDFPASFFVACAPEGRRMMSSLYGTLVFDSTSSNDRLGFTPPYSAEGGVVVDVFRLGLMWHDRRLCGCRSSAFAARCGRKRDRANAASTRHYRLSPPPSRSNRLASVCW